jgi:uncharacterized protein YggE
MAQQFPNVYPGYKKRTRALVPFVWLAIVFMAFGRPLQAQKVSIDAALRTSDKSYVQATGEATVSAKPDQAIIDIGVVTQGATAVSVAAQNAKQTDAVLADLRKIVSGSNRLKTTSYSVRPNFQASKQGGRVAIAGYTAANVVEVTLNDLAQVGTVIDAALQSGANNIQKLEFGLKNPQAARSQALQEAAAQAKASVEAIAAGLGVHVLRVLSAEEFEPGDDFGMAKKAPPSPPNSATPATEVVAGNIEVTATVTLRVEIAQ